MELTNRQKATGRQVNYPNYRRTVKWPAQLSFRHLSP